MGAGVSTTVANAMLTAAVANWDFDQLHTADPGAAGTTAVSSVTTREAVTWGSPASATVAATDEPSWTAWAGTNGENVGYISGWSLVTSGVFQGSMQLSAAVTMDTGDELTLTSQSIDVPVAS